MKEISDEGGARRLGMNLGQLCQEIKVARQQASGLYLEARKLLLQQQQLLVTTYEYLDYALEKLQVAEKELRSSNEDLAAAYELVEVERQRYQNFLEFAPEAYLVTDGKGIIRENNRAAARLLNVPHQFLAGKPLGIFVSKEQRRTFLCSLNRLHQENQGQEWKVCLEPRNGDSFDATLTITTIHKRGEAISIGWLLRRINESKQTDSSLWLLKEAVQQLNESIVITSAELNEPGPTIVFVNQAFTKMTGYTMDELTGKTPRILQGAKTERSTLDQLRQNLTQGETFEGETINYHKDGTEYKVKMSCSPIWNEHREITHFLSIQHHFMLEQA